MPQRSAKLQVFCIFRLKSIAESILFFEFQAWFQYVCLNRILQPPYNLDVRYIFRLIVVLQDRKSTRLNSSHVKISYAVFCLKKKKKNKYNTTSTNHTII